jgi:RES domain-containing protein
MAALYRISNYTDLSGEGAKLFGGRWNSIGLPALYCAENVALALLEVLVHLTKEQIPEHYQLLMIASPFELSANSSAPNDTIRELTALINDLSLNNKVFPHLTETRYIGDAWLKAKTSLMLRVPSAIIPHTCNIIINPMHLLFEKYIKLVSAQSFKYDTRLR